MVSTYVAKRESWQDQETEENVIKVLQQMQFQRETAPTNRLRVMKNFT